jgi:hypothetical protein
MNIKDEIAAQELIIAYAQAEIKGLKSRQGKRFKPEIGGRYFIVHVSGTVSSTSNQNLKTDVCLYENFNMYETEELATKAAKYMKRNNAIIMACSIVDPNFVPDYLSGNQRHYTFYYSAPQMGFIGGWSSLSSIGNNYGPCVSTIEKWEEAAALLKEWGIE